jgi:hypothetical protein
MTIRPIAAVLGVLALATRQRREDRGHEFCERSANPILTSSGREPKIARHEERRSTDGDGAAFGAA